MKCSANRHGPSEISADAGNVLGIPSGILAQAKSHRVLGTGLRAENHDAKSGQLTVDHELVGPVELVGRVGRIRTLALPEAVLHLAGHGKVVGELAFVAAARADGRLQMAGKGVVGLLGGAGDAPADDRGEFGSLLEVVLKITKVLSGCRVDICHRDIPPFIFLQHVMIL